MPAVTPPCKSCPWIKANRAEDIPNFRMDLAERLEASCRQGTWGQPIFACHLSKPDQEFPCAGFLAVHGIDNISVRLALASEQLDPAALRPDPDWPELHADYDEMMEKLRG